MLHYDRTVVPEGIDVNKRSEPKECNIYHYWYYLDKVFKFQLDLCNGCHDVLMISMKLSDIAILNIDGADHRCVIRGISKSKANIDLTKKMEHYKT